MKSKNQFSISLEKQKKTAKKRLKLIQKGDAKALSFIQNYHPHFNSIDKKNIQLADVQFALARELGLPSWPKLKQHIEELERHKQAIKNKEHALDRDLTTLHIRCGHDIQRQLKICGFVGEFLPLIDPLCIGPISANDQDFIAKRAQFVATTLIPIMGISKPAQHIIQAELKNIQILLDDKFERLVFWVEHDSYDQFMLLRALALLSSKDNTVIELIELNNFPGTQRFIGFGQLPAEAIRACWQLRKPITAKLQSQANTCWQALRASKPDLLINIINHHELDCLPNMKNVLFRHLQELPNIQTGLRLTQTLGLQALERLGDNVSMKTWFKEYQENEPLPFLGDMMFYALMLPLAGNDHSFFTIEDSDKHWQEQRFCITEQGIACLSGKKYIQQSYSLGGTAIKKNNSLSWDHQSLASLRSNE
ncbi:DUF1835 domain-containing protein [Glaciecola petra]|uniref:DUF1835 domain-containing protein n=1 Tax=Glaciecola petra TaxID=3075602 RepID=A0ABU2ZUR9_9ALTE|nr:DUF1835 domain-containing protein [Aestuariibacter sp. P117]MDT0596335.1 DUF1835 domain-containing protein [Aestuariibacter sp. P117]